MDRVKRIWYLSPMRAAKVQASLRIRTVSPKPSLLAHTNSESRGTFKQKARSLAPLNGWTCAVEICHNGMLEDTNSLDGAQIVNTLPYNSVDLSTINIHQHVFLLRFMLTMLSYQFGLNIILFKYNSMQEHTRQYMTQLYMKSIQSVNCVNRLWSIV